MGGYVPNFLPSAGGGGTFARSVGDMGYGGMNQWMSYPSMTGGGYSGAGRGAAPTNFVGGSPYLASVGGQSFTNPYMTPSGSSGYAGVQQQGSPIGGGLPGVTGYPAIGRSPSQQTLPYLPGTTQNIGEVQKVGGGQRSAPTLDPAITQAMADYLQGQIGQGVAPFDLSTTMPSTGQGTAPGTLTAPLDPAMQSLQDFFAGQGGGPTNFILPMWQSELTAMQQPIQEQLANLKEQYGSMGLTGSSAAATGLQDYTAQTAAEQQSLLGNLTMQALPMAQQFAGGLQGYDQQAIQNMLQEFMRTSPQANPMLNAGYSMATTFPPLIGSGKGGGVTGLLGALPGAVGAGLGASEGGAGLLSSILTGLAGI